MRLYAAIVLAVVTWVLPSVAGANVSDSAGVPFAESLTDEDENASFSWHRDVDWDTDWKVGSYVERFDFYPGAWVSVAGYTHTYEGTAREYGGMLTVNFPLDRPSVARPPPSSDSPSYASTVVATGHEPFSEGRHVDGNATRAIARSVVSSALRAHGIDPNDSRLESTLSRARWSALLPETRLRAMRLVDERAKEDAYDTRNGYTSTEGANLWLEARLTWRLDRLVFAGEEASLERLRLDRQGSRQRVTQRALELFFSWQRAYVTAHDPTVEPRDLAEASLREIQASAALDAYTGGWFGGWLEQHGGRAE